MNPLTHRVEGTAVHGATPFSMTLISPIAENLYVGGCIDRIELPREIQYVVSLYPWEAYQGHEALRGAVYERMYDADLESPERVLALAQVVDAFRRLGPTLVHCQAGLNRSGLVAALALILGDDMEPADAIALLREKRSPAVLCNPGFERFLLEGDFRKEIC